MNHPKWLQPNKQVYSKQHGVIHIAAIIDENLYFKKGNVNQIIFNWQQEVQDGNLLPINEAPSGKSTIYQEIAAILDGAGKLQSCDIIPAKEAPLYPIPDDIHPAVKDALVKSGITQLYSHQIEAWSAYKQSSDIILQTPTSSGKSISFLIPVMHECLKGKSALVFFIVRAKTHNFHRYNFPSIFITDITNNFLQSFGNPDHQYFLTTFWDKDKVVV